MVAKMFGFPIQNVTIKQKKIHFAFSDHVYNLYVCVCVCVC